MQIDQQSVMKSLMNEGPEAWCGYLRPFEADEPLTGLSMLVIYPFAASRAKKQERLDWAEVAVRAAELEARHRSGIERESALLWAMQLRAWFISRKGVTSEPFGFGQRDHPALGHGGSAHLGADRAGNGCVILGECSKGEESIESGRLATGA
jgi:hypothetical protein